jgi:hypothetical protein
MQVALDVAAEPDARGENEVGLGAVRHLVHGVAATPEEAAGVEEPRADAALVEFGLRPSHLARGDGLSGGDGAEQHPTSRARRTLI